MHALGSAKYISYFVQTKRYFSPMTYDATLPCQRCLLHPSRKFIIRVYRLWASSTARFNRSFVWGTRIRWTWLVYEAIRPTLNMIPQTPFRHQFKISLVITFVEKSLLPPVTPLYYMVRHTWCNRSCYLCHVLIKIKFSVKCQ